MTYKYLIYITFLLLISSSFISFSQNPVKTAYAIRTCSAPQIDGILNDTVWNKAKVISDFTQYLPLYNTKTSQKTEVKILYDDYAIYIGAFMHDNQPDSILKELGNRDDGVNADAFSIQFDTYNNHQDAYYFGVTASGIQTDYRDDDYSYNAVWKSEVKLNDSGWCAELMIPYSAIRFPNEDVQKWGMELSRNIRRHRELDYWAQLIPEAENNLVNFGKLDGLKNIKAPIRLSFTPYISIYAEHYPYDIKDKSNLSTVLSGGLDLKYGINESFTLDLTLLPDFSQVQSDNKVKNLTAFETVYSEQRPFFTEAVDLFNKGGLFYSRRIGGQPENYYNIDDSLKNHEYIRENPEFSKLINAIKISGRNKNGLAIGFLNALTKKTFAEINDSLTGNKRKILTNPLSNYNILVFDKEFKKNSSIYLINTNVHHSDKYLNSNVTGTGFASEFFSNTYKLGGDFAMSQKYSPVDSIKIKDNLGYNYSLGFSKIKGNFHFSLSRNELDNKFDDNALGLVFYNNYAANYLSFNYNFYKPFWKIRSMYNSLSYNYTTNNIADKATDHYIQVNTQLTNLNYLTLWGGSAFSLSKTYDYYEPRTTGKYFLNHKYYTAYAGFSPDYRKKFITDVQLYYSHGLNDSAMSYTIFIQPVLRLSDKFSVNYQINYEYSTNNKGYVENYSPDSVIFGNRKVNTIENVFSCRYIFKNDLSLTLRIRYYYSKGVYNKNYFLNKDGELEDFPFLGNVADFNFSSFNVDMVFNWQFAPGSSMSVVWKNAILNDEAEVVNKYFENLNRTLDSPQLNSISIKLLYYLDYQSLMKKKL